MTGFNSKRDAAANKLQEDLLNYGTAWSQDGKRIDPMSVYKEPVTVREALKLALEALEQLDGIDTETECVTIDVGDVIDAIKEALAQPAQEPDAYQSGYHDGKKAARARCIELVLAGSSMPVQTRTLEALQRDRKWIAALIEEDGKP